VVKSNYECISKVAAHLFLSPTSALFIMLFLCPYFSLLFSSLHFLFFAFSMFFPSARVLENNVLLFLFKPV